jgi:hypothetical protein
MQHTLYRQRLTCLPIGILIVLLTLTACGIIQPESQALAPTETAPANSQPTPPANWASRWLEGVPCSPPCWEGITPGETPASKALEILQRNPIVASAKITTSPLFPNEGNVDWTWKDGGTGGSASFNAQASPQTIDSISVAFPSRFRLSDVMKAYGDPSHIIATAGYNPDIGSGTSAGLVTAYRSHGFAVTADPVLSPDTPLYVIVFFPPSESGMDAAFRVAADHPDFVVPWQGFRGFEFYCRTDLKSKACQDYQKTQK